MSKRKKSLKAKIGVFLKQYARTSKCHIDPNDRGYDRKFERKIKQMKPEELAEIINEEDDIE
jgi:hypothetical protein